MPGDVTVTLTGFVATTPTLFRSQSGNDFTSFRIAQTRRYLDRERGEWVDGRTLWFTVKVWKHVARNVALSLHKGDPVVVTGRLSLDEWDGPDGPRTSLVVEATALGPDLALGEARFARTVHRREGDGARRGEATDGVAGREGGGEGGPDRGARPTGVPGVPAHDGAHDGGPDERELDDPWTLADVGTALAGDDAAPPEGDPAADAADRAETGGRDVAVDEPAAV
ncbi:single-stranded DNA-binding protein [Cellulosimicrobium protaetiae]|uniref:Single-stranded DNA-binding protein n=1 Tax=Cellulosimicrobium protaetiae TaxID=2587808 RepID=A0A6M5UKH7_9MICO|nr:single-stranded DNA-binding protein [Cellulosimicrobium protaetiae]QJW37189.1 single-stranded DNA-binding protein [Cellulosimicrobium protaetiae]